jgi:hypothetical protein
MFYVGNEEAHLFRNYDWKFIQCNGYENSTRQVIRNCLELEFVSKSNCIIIMFRIMLRCRLESSNDLHATTLGILGATRPPIVQ